MWRSAALVFPLWTKCLCVSRCALFLLLNSPAKVFLLELLELRLREQRLRLLGLLGGWLRPIPGLSPWIMAQDLSETERKSTLDHKLTYRHRYANPSGVKKMTKMQCIEKTHKVKKRVTITDDSCNKWAISAFLTFIVSESLVLTPASIKYLRFALIWLFLCFFLNSSTVNTKEEEGV